MDQTLITNLALIRLGAEQLRTWEQSDKRATVLAALFEPMRDAVLCDHPWTFATIRAQLSPCAPAPLFGFRYAYNLPDGQLYGGLPACLKFWGICGASRGGEVDPELLYQVEGSQVLSNIMVNGVLPVKYSRQMTDASRFSAGFVSSFSLRLAAEATPLHKDPSLKQLLIKEYELELMKAKGADSQQGTPRVRRNNPWLAARYGGRRGGEGGEVVQANVPPGGDIELENNSGAIETES